MIPMQIPCGVCKEPVPIQAEPQPKIVNFPTVSLMVLEHSGQVTCPKCNSVINPALAGVAGLALVGAPVPPAEQNLIVPATANGGQTQ